jgi:hypothetical protein
VDEVTGEEVEAKFSDPRLSASELRKQPEVEEFVLM